MTTIEAEIGGDLFSYPAYAISQTGILSGWNEQLLGEELFNLNGAVEPAILYSAATVELRISPDPNAPESRLVAKLVEGQECRCGLVKWDGDLFFNTGQSPAGTASFAAVNNGYGWADSDGYEGALLLASAEFFARLSAHLEPLTVVRPGLRSRPSSLAADRLRART